MKYSGNSSYRSHSINFQPTKSYMKKKISQSLPDNVVGKVKYALGYNNRIIESELTERRLQQRAVNEKLKEFDEKLTDQMENYYNLKEENDNFMIKFKQTDNLANKRNVVNNNRLDNIFHDLILKYKNKQYKIPDLSVNKNLFSPCPLLLDNHKIKEYYNKPINQDIDTDKNVNYLLKMNTLLNDLIITEEPDVESVKNKIKERKSEIFQKLSKKIITNELEKKEEKNMDDIRKEIQENLEYNNNLRLKFREQSSDDILYTRSKIYNNIYNKEKEPGLVERDMSHDGVFNRKTDFLLKNLNKESNLKSRNMYQDYISKRKSQDSSLSTNKNKTSLYGSTKMMSSLISNTNNQSVASPIIPNIKSSIYSATIEKKLNNHNDSYKLNNNNSHIELEFTEINNSNLNMKKGELKDMRSISLIPAHKNNKNYKPNIYKQKTNLNTSGFKEPNLNSTLINSKKTELQISKETETNSTIPKSLRINESPKIQPTFLSPNSKLVKEKEKVSNEREKFLSYYYELINNHEYSNIKEIFYTYAKKFLKQDDKAIDEVVNKKLEPGHIIKFISELKGKVGGLNIPEMYKNSYYGMAKLDSSSQYINNIKELDKLINRLDCELAKKLSKASKN